MNRDRVEQLYKEGKYQEAWWAYTALSAQGDLPADVHQWGAKAAFGLGHLHSALYAMEQGLSVATGDDVGKVRYNHAGMLIALGRYEPAIAELHTWIENLPQYPTLEPVYLGVVYYHLGLACRQLERYTDSMNYYSSACEHLRRHNRREHLCLTLHNMAWVACLQGDEVTAEKALDQAVPLCDTKELHWHQQIGRAFLMAVSRGGDLRKVMTLCEAIIEHKGDDLPMAIRSHAYWLAGRVAMELNLGESARIMAEQALWFAAAGSDDRCLTDASRLIAEVDRRFVATA